MPFKFGFKRARRYNVSSKNSYVVCIQLLDNNFIECTLTSESTGRDCLDNIAQRIELCQTDCFGLRFVNKKLQFRWIELYKPLKKQLDKHANSQMLHFGVMFYIPNAHRIEDEMTRYQYYLQLKMDVIDGKLPCTPEQAVLLASYSVQAEFGDHSAERHTAEYLKNYVLLPRNMTTDDRILANLTLEIVSTHRSLKGLPPAVAELQYIIEAQKLEGYGVEYYPAKVATTKGVENTEVQLGTSFVGIVVKLKKLKSQEHVECFKWSDISNVTHSRRTFGVTSSVNNHTIHFQMDDPDIAKYLYKICMIHHKFYTGNHQDSLYGRQLEESAEGGARCPLQDVQPSSQPPSDITDGQGVAEQPAGQTQTEDASQAACLYQAPALAVDPPQCTSLGPSYTDANAFRADQPIVDMQYGNGHIYQMMVGADIPAIPPVPPVAAPHQHYLQNTKYANNRSVALPAYRPSPAYETVMRQRLEHLQPAMPDAQVIDPRHQDLAGNIHMAQVYMNPETMAYSQPEIGRVPPPYMQYLTQMGRVDGGAYTNGGPDISYAVDRVPRPVDRACSLIIYPTYGTPPDISGAVPQNQYSTSEHFVNEALMNQYKLPPPYPHHPNSSSSTPDLATIQSSHSNLSSSPDLVSRKNIGNGGVNMLSLVRQSQLDQSIENLSLDTQNLNIGHKVAQQAREMSVPSDTNTDSSPVEIFILDPPMPYPVQHAPLQYSQSDVSGMERSIELRLGQTAHPTGNFRNQRMPSQSYSESVTSTHTSDMTELNVDQNTPLEGACKAQDLDECDDMKMKRRTMGPMKVAALNGLTVARGSILDLVDSENRMPADDRRQSLEGRLEEDQVFVEFENIPKKRIRWNCGIAETEENCSRNRFNDVLPYDDCCVKLKPTKDNPTGYINASHLRIDVAGEQWWYIATQAPLPNTLNDFWQMVWEQEVHVISMLTAIEEVGKAKCHLYWPCQPGPQNKVRYGDFVVTQQFSQSSRCYITRGFNMRDMRTGRERLVWHLQYTDWPDHGCPEDAQAFLLFLDELESVRRHVTLEEGTGKLLPTLVHCSAGVGRTGVLILVELVKACLQHNRNIDIPAMLETLRTQRMHLVQTISQYRFVYKSLVQYLKNLRLI